MKARLDVANGVVATFSIRRGSRSYPCNDEVKAELDYEIARLVSGECIGCPHMLVETSQGTDTSGSDIVFRSDAICGAGVCVNDALSKAKEFGGRSYDFVAFDEADGYYNDDSGETKRVEIPKTEEEIKREGDIDYGSW